MSVPSRGACEGDPSWAEFAVNVMNVVFKVPLTAKTALNLFSVLRGWNLDLLASTPAASFSKLVNHPERGEMTFQTLLETMGGHDLNHLGQLEKIASA